MKVTKNSIIFSSIAIIIIILGVYLFVIPKKATFVQEKFDSNNSVLVKSGTFHDGLPLHHVSGNFSIFKNSNGTYVMRVENYEATSGPDVYFYLTKNIKEDNTEMVEGQGLRILVNGGARDGQATLRGSFTIVLPNEYNPEIYKGISVWCRTYNALFGYGN